MADEVKPHFQTIVSGRRVTLPEDVCEALGVGIGDVLRIVVVGKGDDARLEAQKVS